MILVTFYSVSAALYSEKIFRDGAVPCTVIPVPRQISSSCGYAAETGCGDPGMLRGLLDRAGIEWECMYADGDGWTLLASGDDRHPGCMPAE